MRQSFWGIQIVVAQAVPTSNAEGNNMSMGTAQCHNSWGLVLSRKVMGKAIRKGGGNIWPPTSCSSRTPAGTKPFDALPWGVLYSGRLPPPPVTYYVWGMCPRWRRLWSSERQAGMAVVVVCTYRGRWSGGRSGEHSGAQTQAGRRWGSDCAFLWSDTEKMRRHGEK